MKRILVVDNYDSFVYTLNAYLQELGVATDVVRNDVLVGEDAPQRLEAYDAFLLSPGPGHPSEAKGLSAVIEFAYQHRKPLLGVCLGHQAVVEHFGGRVDVAPYLMHGKSSYITHEGAGVFLDIENPCSVMRYHSLAAQPECEMPNLRITSHTQDGIIMSVQHQTHPIFGVQFHPESIATKQGQQMLANWLSRV